MKILLTISALFFSVGLFAQDTNFTKVYYSESVDYEDINSKELIPNRKGGVTVVGHNYKNPGLLFSLDSLGNINWNIQLSDSNSVIRLTDGFMSSDSSIVIAGYNYVNHFFCVKLDASGDTLWSRSFVNQGFDEYNDYHKVSINELSDSSYILINSNSKDSTIHMAKLSENGIVEWQKRLDGIRFQLNGAFAEASDSTFLISGFVDQVHGGVIKMSKEGNVVWSRKYMNTKIFDVIQMENGNIYAICNDEIGLIKIDHTGDLIWYRQKEGAFDMFPYFTTGYPSLTRFSDSTFLYKTTRYDISEVSIVDTNGITLYQSSVYGPVSDVKKEKDRVFISSQGPVQGIKAPLKRNHVGIMYTNDTLAGTYCTSTISSAVNVLDTTFTDTLNAVVSNFSAQVQKTFFIDSLDLVKKNGCISYLSEVDKHEPITISVYPNVTSGATNFKLSKNDHYQVEIINLNGQRVGQFEIIGSYESFDLSSEPPGIYFYKVYNENTSLTGKIIKR